MLMVLLLAVITVPILWGMLDLNVKTQHRSAARSQLWNGTLPLVEAGIEEGLAHLNQNCYSNIVNEGLVRWHGVDGWTRLSNGVFQATRRYVGDSYYDLWISTNAPVDADSPQIVCVAYTPSLFGKMGLLPIYGAIGQAADATSYIARQVRVGTLKNYLFTAGSVSRDNTQWNGRCRIDSFDSQNSTNSFYGLYDSRYITDNAQVIAIDGSINLGAQGVLYGSAGTGPEGSLSNGTVGDKEWIAAGNTGLQPGHYQTNVNMNLRDVRLPSGAESWPLLSVCNCSITITNPVRLAKMITSPTYPSPPPPGGILATNSALVTTDYYPSPVPATGVETNLTLFTSVTYPTPEPPFGVRTNVDGTFVTQTNYPSLFVTPPGVTTNVLLTTNINIQPPVGSYLGSVTTQVINPTGGGNKDRYTNYIFNSIQGYSFKPPQSYTWTNYSYTYLVDTAYRYVGAQTNQEIVTKRYKYVAYPGKWKLQSLDLSGQERMLIRAQGHTTLYVSGAISMSGQSQIVIEDGASLSIYVGGNVNMSGQGIANENDSALNFSLYGLNSCTNIQIGGNASLTGTIYAPHADIKCNGGGNNTEDIIGAIIGKTVTFNGHFNLHYDEALGRVGPSDGFVATQWIEETASASP
ncbi:MAG: hypothetical protein ACK4UN_06050 [Limisphaerales bacterium]